MKRLLKSMFCSMAVFLLMVFNITPISALTYNMSETKTGKFYDNRYIYSINASGTMYYNTNGEIYSISDLFFQMKCSSSTTWGGAPCSISASQSSKAIINKYNAVYKVNVTASIPTYNYSTKFTLNYIFSSPGPKRIDSNPLLQDKAENTTEILNT